MKLVNTGRSSGLHRFVDQDSGRCADARRIGRIWVLNIWEARGLDLLYTEEVDTLDDARRKIIKWLAGNPPKARKAYKDERL